MFLGEWYIDDVITFTACTHNVSTGAGCDADDAPTYRIYEDETSTPILTGSMAKLDDENTVGYYSEQIQLTEENGFEYSKTYSIYIEGEVSGVVGTVCYTFKIKSDAEHRIRNAGLRMQEASVYGGTFTPTESEFETEDITVDLTDHYKYRVIMFTTGVLADQARDITAYSLQGAYGHFTTTPFSTAPSDGDKFIII